MDQLKAYVKQCLKLGYKKQQIKEYLLRYYPPEQVNKAMGNPVMMWVLLSVVVILIGVGSGVFVLSFLGSSAPLSDTAQDTASSLYLQEQESFDSGAGINEGYGTFERDTTSTDTSNSFDTQAEDASSVASTGSDAPLAEIDSSVLSEDPNLDISDNMDFGAFQ